MKTWLTEVRAICPIRGELITFCGPDVKGITKEDAENYCQTNELGYCKVIGELIAEIPCDENYKADFSKMIDYQNPGLN